MANESHPPWRCNICGVIFTENARNARQAALLCVVDKTAQKFRNFAEAEKADHAFYKKLTGNERLQILVDLLNHGPEQT